MKNSALFSSTNFHIAEVFYLDFPGFVTRRPRHSPGRPAGSPGTGTHTLWPPWRPPPRWPGPVSNNPVRCTWQFDLKWNCPVPIRFLSHETPATVVALKIPLPVQRSQESALHYSRKPQHWGVQWPGRPRWMSRKSRSPHRANRKRSTRWTTPEYSK